MIVRTSRIPLPEVGKITSDVLNIDRKSSILPFKEIGSEVRNRFKCNDVYEKYQLYIDYIKNECPDFSPIQAKLKNPEGVSIKRLEDVHPYDIQVYLERAIYSFNKRKEEGFADFKRKNTHSTGVLSNTASNDDDSETLMSEILEEKRNNNIQVSRWKNKLIYLLVRLHEKGKIFGISTLSCIRAMVILSEANPSIKKYKISSLIAYGIWKMDCITGECTEKYVSNTGKLQQYFQYWLNGTPGYKDIFYEDMCEFIDICQKDKLNIDLANINPIELGEQYIRKFKSSYLPQNDSIARTIYTFIHDRENSNNMKNIKTLNPIYQEKLKSKQISKFLLNVTQNGEDSYENDIPYLIEHSKNLFMQSSISKDSISSGITILYKVFGIESISNFYYDNGFMYDNRTASIRIFNISKVLGINNSVYNCIYHNSGNMIKILDTFGEDFLIYCPIALLFQYKEAALQNTTSNIFKYSIDGKKLSWGETLIYSF